MSQQVLLDTGPLVAFINPRDDFHDWVVAEWTKVSLPLLTCKAIITETCFLLQNVYRGTEEALNLLDTEIIHIPFSLNDEVIAIHQLLARYQSVPMSLADACLVRMAELYSNHSVLTLDSDFNIYRKNRNRPIPMVMSTNA